MSHKIVRRIPRPEAGLCKLLGEYGVATVHEAQGRVGLMASYMRPIYPTAKVWGPAITAYCQAGDNLMLHAAVEMCQPGDVLVVTTASPSTDGMFGELLGTSLRSRGVAGLVIEAGCRDVADLTAMDFPVWSRAIHSQGTVKATAGSVNIPIVCAGQAVRPGDVIIGDIDGVCVVPRLNAAAVVESSKARLEKEAKARERLRAGELGLDFYGLRAKLAELGVVYVDQENE
jgi:4-hydroxy-4-methyl-2-oxoglutarate aldolase